MKTCFDQSAARRRAPVAAVLAGLAASCAVVPAPDPVETPPMRQTVARAETDPVPSFEDAADDPAIWVNLENRAASRILGTDKKHGLFVYNLQGRETQRIPLGRLNNVDVRQWLEVGGWSGDLAAATNRSTEAVELFTVEKDGTVVPLGPFAAEEAEPYGLCMGRFRAATLVFVTHKSGAVRMWRLKEIGPKGANVQFLGRIKFKSQVEGCVFDDQSEALFVGEENRGIWRVGFARGGVGEPELIAKVGEAGLAADVEGLAVYRTRTGGFLLASSQGNDSYIAYQRYRPFKPVGRFRIVDNVAFGVDGVQETDGIEATSVALGPDFPDGILVVQDGSNAPAGNPQNFKLVDWRDLSASAVSRRDALVDRLADGYGDPGALSEITPFEGGAVIEER